MLQVRRTLGRENRTRGLIVLLCMILVYQAVYTVHRYNASQCVTLAFIVGISDAPHNSNTGVHTG
jgi:hypothetical protein